jgi:hypothetical protein
MTGVRKSFELRFDGAQNAARQVALGLLLSAELRLSCP